MPDFPAKALEPRNGQVITFYSYKGGTGRTMALANVAWILAANGRRVLVADWDLESPGLHRFFRPFLDEADVRNASGIIDMVRSYESLAVGIDSPEEMRRLISESTHVQRDAISLGWDFQNGGSLDFLSPGRQNFDYSSSLASMDWNSFYERLNGGEFVDAIRADMKAHYDYVLIDSRTGLSDIAAICTAQLPDVLVDCFTLSMQGIVGAAEVARSVEQRHAHRGIRILPVPMRVEPYEMEKVEAGRLDAERRFAGLPSGMTEDDRRKYWTTVEVPYKPFYAYEETLAVFGDAPGRSGTLLAAFEQLTAYITNDAITKLPPMEEQVRSRVSLQFIRKPPQVSDRVIVEFLPEDEVWGEWIADILRSVDIGVGVEVRPLPSGDLPADETAGRAQTLTVVSARFVDWYRARPEPKAAPQLPIYVTSTRAISEFSGGRATFIIGMTEQDAIGRLLRLVGVTGKSIRDLDLTPGIRYPGNIPAIYQAPTPNPLFTGRQGELHELRELLGNYGTASEPVVLSGLAGVGKTQIVLEYVNRYKTDYDLVYWIACSQPQFIDATLADLLAEMNDRFKVSAPVTDSVAEAVRVALDILSEGRRVPRWLLIFDSAEASETILSYLPKAGGQVLITSRSRDWPDSFRQLQVESFTPEDSVAHLRRRVPSIQESEARDLAKALGYFPVGVAAAGAYLDQSPNPVPDYLAQLESQTQETLARAQETLAREGAAIYPGPVSKAWQLSLQLLRQRSPAAYRLFELCSVMASEIKQDVLYSSAMASVLEPIDPVMAEPDMIGTAVREIDKLALIKLDRGSAQVVVHPLVQSVVREGMSHERLVAASHDVHRVLAACRPSRGVDIPETWDRYRMLWPHLRPSHAAESADDGMRQLLTDRVRYLWLRSDLERGRDEAERYEAAWVKQLNEAEQDEAARQAQPDATPQSAESAAYVMALRRQILHLRFNRANILRYQDRFRDAEELDQQVLHEQLELLGPAHLHTLMTAGGLAGDLRALGRYREALERDQATYPTWMERFGESHPRTLAAANNLAESYRLTGSIATAQTIDERTLEQRRTILGPLHPLTFYSASSLVRDLLEAGRYTEAVSQIETVWQSCAETFGGESLEALNARVLLGIALRNAGQFTAAEEHFLAAFSGLEARLGGETTATLASRLGHALNLLALGHAAQALTEIAAVQKVYDGRLGAPHPHSLVCQLDRACALRAEDRADAAMEAIGPAAEGLREVLGADHPYALAGLSVLGVALADQRKLAEAEAIETEVVSGLTRTLGPHHPDTLRCRANLLLTRVELGTSEARAERNQVITELRGLLGEDHPHIGLLRADRRLLHTLDPQPF